MQPSISKKQLREFAFLIGIGIPIFIGFIIPLLGGHSFKLGTLWITIPVLITGIISPRLLFYPYKLWMALGYTLGWINNRIILGFVFFLVLYPISIIMKFFRYDPLRLKETKKDTYRENKIDHNINLKRLF